MDWGQGVTRAKAVPAQKECGIGRLLMIFFFDLSVTCSFRSNSDHTKSEYLSTGSEVAMATHKERITSRWLDILTGS